VRAHGVLLFVIGDDSFEEISEAFVASGFVFACHLEEQAFQLVQASQAVTGDGIGEARSKHDELVLTLVFGCAGSSAHGVVKAAKSTASAGIHIAHAGDDDVGLVVQVEAVSDELVDFDFGRAVTEAAASMLASLAWSAVRAAVSSWTIASASGTAASSRTVFSGRTIFSGLRGCRLISHDF
jgi:hypothetical protein